MFQPLFEARLKTGESVSVALIHAPDQEWAGRLERLLSHKGDPWNWQNSELLRVSTRTNARFYVLHRNGQPFSSIMLVESAGVALLGHVWTEPADRGAGASGILMDVVLQDFKASHGQAIFLGTEPDSEPFRYYARRGFVPAYAESGYMVWTKRSVLEFEANWFDGEEPKVESLDWPHWPAAAPLCLADDTQQIRLAATGMIGRVSSEGALLPVIRRERQAVDQGSVPCAAALCAPRGAVLGLASLLPDPMWPGQDVLDLFCHARAWDHAEKLLESLPLKAGRISVAYTDVGATRKSEVLTKTGYRREAILPAWLHGREDVVVWRRG
jgi:hypothetical protein